MKDVTFENQISRERVICSDTRNVQVIDGVTYLAVHKVGNERTFLARQDTLKRVEQPRRK